MLGKCDLSERRDSTGPQRERSLRAKGWIGLGRKGEGTDAIGLVNQLSRVELTAFVRELRGLSDGRNHGTRLSGAGFMRRPLRSGDN